MDLNPKQIYNKYTKIFLFLMTPTMSVSTENNQCKQTEVNAFA